MIEIDNNSPTPTDLASPDSPSGLLGNHEQELETDLPTPQRIVEEAIEHSGADRLAVLSEVAMQTAHLTISQRLAALDALQLTGVSLEEIRALKGDLVRQEVSRQAVRASLRKRGVVGSRFGL